MYYLCVDNIVSFYLCMHLIFVLYLCASDGGTDEGGGASQGRAEK